MSARRRAVVGVEAFGHAKEAWLRQFLTLPNSIPAHDTIGARYARLDPHQFEQCFLKWVTSVFERTAGKVVTIDGKTLRRSQDWHCNKAAIHMVSAWATTHHIVPGQVKVADKSNEISAIPDLLSVLDVHGCIVTIDAMAWQQDIATQIIDQQGDYVLEAV